MAVGQLLGYSVQTLVNWIDSGRVQLPEFQRSFKWPDPAQISLLDSIQRRFPVGTLLLLAAGPDGSSAFGSRSFEGASAADQKPEFLVLDGQQRLGTCLAALKGAGSNVFCLDLAGLFAATKGAAGEVVDFNELVKKRPTPTIVDSLLMTQNLLPLTFLTNRDALRERLANYRVELAKSDAEFAKFVETRLQGYVDVFFEYEFPCVVLPYDLDVEAISTVFTKINSTGLRLSSFDLCVAAMYPKGVRLRQMLKDAKAGGALDVVETDGTNVLQTVALLAGKVAKKAGLPKNLSAADVGGFWGTAVGAMAAADDMLESLGIADRRGVPYDGLIPPLAAVLARTDLKAPVAQEAARHKAGRWVYQTALAQRYTEGLDSKQTTDFETARKWFASGELPGFLEEPALWHEQVKSTGRAGARFRAFIGALNDAGPEDLMSGKTLGKGEGRESSELHHIFPRSYLAGLGVPEVKIDRVLNLTFLTKATNTFINDRAPSVYINGLIERAVQSGKDPAAAERDLRQRLMRHLIDEKAWDALRADDYDAFVEARANVFRSQFEARFGVHLLDAPASSSEEIDETEGEASG